jgi:hypothetical protein
MLTYLLEVDCVGELRYFSGLDKRKYISEMVLLGLKVPDS